MTALLEAQGVGDSNMKQGQHVPVISYICTNTPNTDCDLHQPQYAKLVSN